MSNNKTNKIAISEDLALTELEGFLSIWIKRAPKGEEAKEQYPETLDALMEGNLVIDEKGVPVYKLIHPIEGEFGKTEITFKTRITLSTQTNLLKGVKDDTKRGLVIMAYLLGFDSTNELDLLHKWDFKAVSEIATVFL